MATKKYKAAVIGCGKIGTMVNNYQKEVQPATHAGAWLACPRTELVGLADIHPERLKSAAQYFPGVPLFDSVRAMLIEKKPDIVSIATPPNSHLALVKLAAQCGTKAIICEKPIAESEKEARAIIEVCRKNKSLLFINHQRRFDPLIGKWREKIKKGFIGDIIQASCYYYNGLFNNGTHTIDLLRFFLDEVEWLSAILNPKTTATQNHDKNVDALLGFKNGVRVSLQSLVKNYCLAEYYFYGNKGMVAIKNLGYEIEYRKLIKNKYYKGYYQLSDPIIKEGRVRSFMGPMADHVVSCLDGKAKPQSRGEDGLADLKTLLALKESAENNGKLLKLKH